MKPLLNGDSSFLASKNAKQSVLLALRCMHAYYSRFDEISEEDLSASIDAIEDCVSACRLPVETTAELFGVTKFLTNFVAKAAKMVRSNSLIVWI